MQKHITSSQHKTVYNKPLEYFASIVNIEFGKVLFSQTDTSFLPMLLAIKFTIRRNNSIIPKEYTNAVKSLKKKTMIAIKIIKIIKSI